MKVLKGAECLGEILKGLRELVNEDFLGFSNCLFTVVFLQHHHQSHPPLQPLAPPPNVHKPSSPTPPPSYAPPPGLDTSHPSLHHALHPANVFDAVNAHYGQAGLHLPPPDLPAHLTGGQPERCSPPHLNQHALVSPPGEFGFQY